MYYLLILLSTFLFAVQFIVNDGYQKESGSNLTSSLKFSLYSSAAGFAALMIINRFELRCSAFSLAVAAVYALVCVSLNYFTVKALRIGHPSSYSVFSMIGGMVLPFLYGLLCGEEFKAIRIVCCALIAVSVVLHTGKGESTKAAFRYYMAVFVLNGMVGVISKFHQSHPLLCVASADFLMLSKLFTVGFSAVLLGISGKRGFSIGRKAFGLAAGSAVLNSVANLLLLLALLKLPASVQYPLVTGGVILFSTLFDVIRKAGVKKKEMAAALTAFAAAALMAL